MRIGLVDVDSHNFPNLALMKLCAHHRAQGDRVEWWTPEGRYDLVYKSRVFTDEYTTDQIEVKNADKVLLGGTGYGLTGWLPDAIEHICPAYDLYPQFGGAAYGFLTRGCPRACGFCIVAEKEGRRARQTADLNEFWRGQKQIVLLDANILAAPEHEALLRQLAGSRAWVDFTQGLDIRLTTPDNIRLLDQIKVKTYRFAWDDPREDLTPHFRRFAQLSRIQNFRRRRVYMLCNFNTTHDEDLYRVYTLRALGFDPYVMVFNKAHAPHRTRQLQRWVNNKWVFHTVPDFKDYVPM